MKSKPAHMCHAAFAFSAAALYTEPMYRILKSFLSIALVAFCPSAPAPATEVPDVVELSFDDLRDKIRGGWAAQTIGVTFGGPTEFCYNGTMIDVYESIPWYDGYLLETFTESPGLYDDIYMDLTFVEVLEEEGLDASPVAFGKAFAEREYKLWHANQMARYNIRNGIEPPASGHWLNNPEADTAVTTFWNWSSISTPSWWKRSACRRTSTTGVSSRCGGTSSTPAPTRPVW